ncbi:MAG: HAD family hydrolase [Promethearchaeota archaeon]
MTIKAIIFDLGGVLVDLDFTKFLEEIIEISPLNKPHSLLLLEFWRQSDRYHQGKISDEEFFHQSCELLQFCDLNQERFYESFNSVISGKNEEVIEILNKIKLMKKYKLILLSNVNSSHWNYLRKMNWKFLNIFDDYILSFKVKMTKPDPQIFKLAIEKAGCSPNEIVYIDDGLNNISSARELGIYTIHFTDIKELIKEFKKLEIIDI